MGHQSSYSESYKLEAVAKAEASGNISQTARELGISSKTLHAWIVRNGDISPKNAGIKSPPNIA